MQLDVNIGDVYEWRENVDENFQSEIFFKVDTIRIFDENGPVSDVVVNRVFDGKRPKGAYRSRFSIPLTKLDGPHYRKCVEVTLEDQGTRMV